MYAGNIPQSCSTRFILHSQKINPFLGSPTHFLDVIVEERKSEFEDKFISNHINENISSRALSWYGYL